jgi:hypothetical protein
VGVKPLVSDKLEVQRHLQARAVSASSNASHGASNDNDAAITALLQKKLPEVRFDAIGMSDVIDFLRDITGANISVNWRALEAAGIDRNTPLTMLLREVTFEQVLNQIVRDVSGGGQAKVEFATEGGVVVLSTQEELAQHPQLRSFDVSDLLKPEDKTGAAELEKVVIGSRPQREDLRLPRSPARPRDRDTNPRGRKGA